MFSSFRYIFGFIFKFKFKFPLIKQNGNRFFFFIINQNVNLSKRNFSFQNVTKLLLWQISCKWNCDNNLIAFN